MIMGSDGSNSVARESKFGLLTSTVLGIVATGAIGYLGTLNVSSLPGWAAEAGTLAITTAIGFLVAYKTKNVKA
jgi:hypothetical protein